MTDHTILRRGWTTGACATAAAKSACAALLTGDFADPVTITLPNGSTADFVLAETARTDDTASAAIIKDAGDDPDVTHGALIRVTLRRATPGAGVVFRAGAGVGTVTRPGLPIPPGEPAINPVPRAMIRAALAEIAGPDPDFIVEIAIPGGAALAERTLNGRLGIVGGLSVLGTTGVVIPFSCAAWIDSIHRGIDVARAVGLTHVAGSTGRTSERAVQALHGLDDVALIEMGDFVGGMLKYLRRHPVARVTIAGGLAKMTKLAQGRLDLHSRRHAVDRAALADLARGCGGTTEVAARIMAANTTAEAFDIAAAAGIGLGAAVARAAWATAAAVLAPAAITLEIAVFDRAGALVASSGFRPVHDAAPLSDAGRNLRS
ncbi:cobalt-precorrin-5B (C(1))-methyltransferase [Acidiphilium sp.]|uniref:cobalt-precorrin-5B (C(1))-methyltransferase n=1 Tax=Acidiphilium sp. TaxID=527 RepID=UPI003CFFEBA4